MHAMWPYNTAILHFRLNTYRPSGILGCWPDGLELSPGILFGIQRAAQTVLGVYLNVLVHAILLHPVHWGFLAIMHYTNPHTHSHCSKCHTKGFKNRHRSLEIKRWIVLPEIGDLMFKKLPHAILDL